MSKQKNVSTQKWVLTLYGGYMKTIVKDIGNNILITIGILFIMGVIGFLFYKGIGLVQAKSFINSEEPIIIEETELTNEVKKEKTKNYLAETIYDGTGEVPYKLYEVPFEKSEEYISNKEYLPSLSDEKINQLQDDIKNFFELNYNTGYRTMSSNPQSFIDSFKKAYCNNYIVVNDVELSTEDYAKNIIEDYINNNISMSAEFITDKSLIYYDSTITYVRGLLKIKVFSGNDLTELGKRLQIDNMEIGKEYEIGYDIGVVYNTQYQIFRIEPIK